uniref:Uncharacterized protein n=1 Tax=Borely moumouvirus TaxID=2712067 RepID=A0A6G6ACW7_9VIRU
MFYLGIFLVINKCDTNIFVQFVIGSIIYILTFIFLQKNIPKEYLSKYFYLWILLIVTDLCIWTYLRIKCYKTEQIKYNDIIEDDDIVSDSEDYTITHSSTPESENITDIISDESNTIFI